VRVDQGVRKPEMSCGERVVRERVGEGARRVAGEAPVEVLAVVGNHERGAGAERRQVQHRDRDDAAAQFPLLETAGPLADGGHRRVLAAVHSGQHDQARAVPGAGHLDDGAPPGRPA
jgi:hypothetical protein